MYQYSQSTGSLSRDGKQLAIGYSGHGAGKNNPDMQEVHNVGPIPVGMYAVISKFDSPKCGPYCLRLKPAELNEMFDRSGFLIHGDNADHTASEGCIILAREIRELIWNSDCNQIEVVR